MNISNFFKIFSFGKKSHNEQWNRFLDILINIREEDNNQSMTSVEIPVPIWDRLKTVTDYLSSNEHTEEKYSVTMEQLTCAFILFFMDWYNEDLHQLKNALQKRYESQGYIPYLQQRYELEKRTMLEQYESKLKEMQEGIQSRIDNALAGKEQEIKSLKDNYDRQIKQKDDTIASQQTNIKNLEMRCDKMIDLVPNSQKPEKKGK